MGSEEVEIRVIGVDKERIRESTAFRGTWIVPFKLSAKPDDSWIRNFNDVAKKNMDIKKKDSHVVEDCIEVNCSDADVQQQVLDLLKRDINDTNTVYKEMSQKKKKMQEELKAMQEKQITTLQRLKDDADKLKF